MQEEYHAKKGKRLYMCFVDIEKAFDRVPLKVSELAMRKKRIIMIIVEHMLKRISLTVHQSLCCFTLIDMIISA